MRQLLDEMELALTDLFQMGFSTAGPEIALKMTNLSTRAENTGLHTGAELFSQIAGLLESRAHSMDKTDKELTAAVCRAEYYITLCRTRLTEEDIRRRWQEGGTT